MQADLLERLVLRPVAAGGIRYIEPVRPARADGLVAQVYRQMRDDFLLVAPLMIHSPDPPLLAAAWAAVRECVIAGPADRISREEIAVAVSRKNACPYCADAHGMMLSGATARPSTPKLVGNAEREAERGALADAQRAGTRVVFHYINRMVNVFIGASPFPRGTPESLKHALGRLTARRIAHKTAVPGRSLELLAAGSLPPDLGWAAVNQSVSGALAALSAECERAGAAAVPVAVLAMVRERLRLAGNCELTDQAEIENALSGLADGERAVGRLCLTTALASRRVAPSVIRACRAQGSLDADIVGAAAWAAFAAARRTGGVSRESEAALAVDASAPASGAAEALPCRLQALVART